MKLYRLMVSILCMALLMVLCLPVVCSAEITPFAEAGNVIQAWMDFSGNMVNVGGKVVKLKAGCTAKTTVYVQAKSGSSWIAKTSGSGSREARASYTAQRGTEYRAYAIAKIYDSNGKQVDTLKGYSSSSTY